MRSNKISGARRATKPGRSMVMAIVALIGVISCAGLMACHSQSAGKPSVRRYQLKGKVVALNRQQNRVTIEHQDIPGYMEAMTMPFPLKDERLYDRLKEGDQIEAVLVVDANTNRSWLEDVTIKEH